MNIMSLGSSVEKQAGTTSARKAKSELGKQDFLQLLVTQVRNQDPLKPMEDREFISQLAQFSSLEQMMNVGQSVSLTYGMGLLNKQVYASDADGHPVVGKAVSIRVVEGKPMLKIEPKSGPLVEVDLNKVSQVDV